MNNPNKPFVIGITGAFGSGKSTAADFFETKGFVRITLSVFLEEELRKRNLPITRKYLQDVGNEWREKLGKGILAKKALEKVTKEKLNKVIIDGIRNIGEIEVLHEDSQFVLLAIVADRKIRFERLQKQKRREKLTWKLFSQLEYRDLGIESTENGLHVATCIALADFYRENNQDKEVFLHTLQQFLSSDI